MNQGILGVIAYLDTDEVDNLLASIEGGLVEQFIESKKISSTQEGEGKVGLSSTSIGSKIQSIREDASEAIRHTTPVSKLTALRKILIDNDYVKQLFDINIEKRNEFYEGELVEIYGSTNPSAFGEFVDVALEFYKLSSQFGELFGSSMNIDPKTDQIFKYLEHIISKGVPIQILCASEPGSKSSFDFASILHPDYLKIKKNSLSGNFKILGRVKKVLNSNEVVYLYDLIPGISRLSRDQFKTIMNSLTKKPISGLNITLTERDFRIKYPTIVISPIAMYS
jgi:hypothetical protein